MAVFKVVVTGSFRTYYGNDANHRSFDSACRRGDVYDLLSHELLHGGVY